MSIPKDPLRINPPANENPLLKLENGHFVGKNPLALDEKIFVESGHRETPIGKVIQKKCLDCSGFSKLEVKKCACTPCPLWPYRMGKNPFLSLKAKSRPCHFAKSEAGHE